MALAVRRFLKDIQRAIGGIFAIVRYACSADVVSVSISLFSADAAHVRRGEDSRYELILVNNTVQHCWMRVLIDIYLRENQTHPHGHVAYFAKHIFVRSRGSQRVAVMYDWQEHARFLIDGVVCAPDRIWRGPCQADGVYLIRAMLFTDKEEPCEALTLTQRVFV